MIESPDEYISELSLNSLITRLKDGGFIIGDNVNEFSKISKQIQSAIDDDYCNITILTSYACNFSCWYCVQKHKGIYIDSSTEGRIKNYIESFLNNHKNIHYFHISWFGGEPLLNFDAIRNISLFAKKVCVLNNIHFACGITTNGSLLNQTMIEEMKQLNFIDFQITIDGAKENHNKTRYNSKINDSFSLLLTNIAKVVKTIPDVLLTLRINYTRTNLSPNIVNDIDKILNPVREKIFVLFRKVWQEPYDETMLKQVSSLSSQFMRLGYIIEHDFDRSDMLTCYAEHKHYITIFPNGAVDKCTNKDVFVARGVLSEGGEIIWEKTPE